MFFHGKANMSASEFGAIPEAGTTTELTRDVLAGDRSTLNKDHDPSRNTQEAYFGDPTRNALDQPTSTIVREHLTFGGNDEAQHKHHLNPLNQETGNTEIHIDLQ